MSFHANFSPHQACDEISETFGKSTQIRARTLDNKSCEGLCLRVKDRFIRKLEKPTDETPIFSHLFMNLMV